MTREAAWEAALTPPRTPPRVAIRDCPTYAEVEALARSPHERAAVPTALALLAQHYAYKHDAMLAPVAACADCVTAAPEWWTQQWSWDGAQHRMRHAMGLPLTPELDDGVDGAAEDLDAVCERVLDLNRDMPDWRHTAADYGLLRADVHAPGRCPAAPAQRTAASRGPGDFAPRGPDSSPDGRGGGDSVQGAGTGAGTPAAPTPPADAPRPT